MEHQLPESTENPVQASAGALDLASVLLESVTELEDVFERHGGTGLQTGFRELDELTGGLQKGELIVIGGRPSMGKTSLALNIVEQLALVQKRPVAVFSLEMTGKRLMQRMLCSHARVNLLQLRRRLLSKDDFENLTSSANTFAGSPLHIVDTSPLSVSDLATCARTLRSTQRIELIVVDHLQLLGGRQRSGALKELAKELDVPVLALAQLNRRPESRAGGIPRMFDLRDAGTVELDADVIALLVRHEYYASDEEARDAMRGEVTLLIAKQKHGPVGKVELTFLDEFTRFENKKR